MKDKQTEYDEHVKWLAQLLGTPENVKKLSYLLFPKLTADKLWDGDELRDKVIDAETIEGDDKLNMEYLGARYLAIQMAKNNVRSLVRDIMEIISPKKETKKDDKNPYV